MESSYPKLRLVEALFTAPVYFELQLGFELPISIVSLIDQKSIPFDINKSLSFSLSKSNGLTIIYIKHVRNDTTKSGFERG